MHNARVALEVLRYSIFCGHFTWSGIIEPEVQTTWIVQATYKTIAGVGL
jgi:hypothetical protein